MPSIRERNMALILRAASQEFAERGFSAARTSDIAERAGLPKPNIYYYFKTKENLYREVLESIVVPLLNASVPFDPEGHPSEVLPAYIREKLRISREHPAASKVFASEIMHGAPHFSAERMKLMDDQARHNIRCIEGWIARGWMDPVDPNHLLFSLWAATQTYADFDWQILNVLNKPSLTEDDFELAISTLSHIIMKGCGVQPRD